jgi:hypothetical protein
MVAFFFWFFTEKMTPKSEKVNHAHVIKKEGCKIGKEGLNCIQTSAVHAYHFKSLGYCMYLPGYNIFF